MAGAIIVSESAGVSLNGLEFAHIIDAIRPILSVHDNSLVNQIWEPVDEGGMDFISVESLNVAGYQAFYESAREANARELQTNPASPFKRAWGELLETLSADPRTQSTQSGS